MESVGSLLIVSGVYSMVTPQHEATWMKIVAASVRGTKISCVIECLQQEACLYSHSSSRTCYLLGTDALIGQDTTYSLQPQDLLYTVRHNAGTNLRKPMRCTYTCQSV